MLELQKRKKSTSLHFPQILMSSYFCIIDLDFKDFVNTCSRVMVHNPLAIAKMRLPSVPNLRKLAKGTHFVASNGELLQYPAKIVRPKFKIALSDTDGADVEIETANERLRKFLEDEGLAEVST